MPNSSWDYDYQQAAQIAPCNYWHALMMAAMIEADSTARLKLVSAFPEIARDLAERGHTGLIPERAERGDQPRAGARVTPGADAADYDPAAVCAELSQEMGGMHPVWAPQVIANLIKGSSAAWESAVSATVRESTEGI